MKKSDCVIVSFIFNEDESDNLMVVGRSKEKGAEYPHIINSMQGERVKEIYALLTQGGKVSEDTTYMEELSKEKAN